MNTNVPKENPSRFSPAVEDALRKASWFSGRCVEDKQMEEWSYLKFANAPGYCRIFPKAFTFLQEFGGLQIGEHGPGISCMRSPFHFNPLEGIGREDESWLYIELALGEPLFPIGIDGDDHDDGLLIIGASGRVYLSGASYLLCGETPEQALENLILGIMPQDLNINSRDEEIMRRVEIIYSAVSRVNET